jgi:hypothetical protein
MTADPITISQAARQRLIKTWGPECILRCCKDWLSHVMPGMSWGTCKICGKKPEMVSQSWDRYLES